MHRSAVMVCAALVLGLVLGAARAETIESVTTSLDLKKCRHSAGKDDEDYGSWRCRGLGGIAVHVAAGDQRSFVSYGASAAREPAARQTLMSFNGEGKAIEWRGTRRADKRFVPFATIMRWSTTVSGEDKPVRGAMLVVTRLGPGGVCHVGYVDAQANADAAALAQQIADERARSFRCGTDKPVILGKQGPGFSGPANE